MRSLRLENRRLARRASARVAIILVTGLWTGRHLLIITPVLYTRLSIIAGFFPSPPLNSELVILNRIVTSQ